MYERRRATRAVMATLAAAVAALFTPAAQSSDPEAVGPEPPGSAGVAGVVRYLGDVPDPVIVVQGADDQQVLHVGADGGLRYAVAYLAGPGAAGAVDGSRELEPVVLDQRGYIFRPPVLAVRDGQLVRFTSQDPGHHNVHSADPNPANAFSLTTTGGLVPAQHRFSVNRGYRPVELGCDIHPWMAAWVYVFDHPRFAVTDAGGRFEIPAPPGDYRLSVRQPAGGLVRDVEVVVEPGRVTRIDVDFTTGDLAPAR